MVTLLGVRSVGDRMLCLSVAFEEFSLRGGVSEARACPSADGVAVMRSADMLLCVRSPLSRRGRFLVTEESASSIGLRRGGLGPAEVARGSVEGRPIGTDSITLLSRGVLRIQDGGVERLL